VQQIEPTLREVAPLFDGAGHPDAIVSLKIETPDKECQAAWERIFDNNVPRQSAHATALGLAQLFITEAVWRATGYPLCYCHLPPDEQQEAAVKAIGENRVWRVFNDHCRFFPRLRNAGDLVGRIEREHAAAVHTISGKAAVPDGPQEPAAGGAKSGGSNPISREEADAVARKLDAKDPKFRLGTAVEWAARIEKASRKHCSATTVKKTRLWDEVMTATNRGRSKARPSRPLRGKCLEVVSAREDADTVQDDLIQEEMAAAIQVVENSGMIAEAKRATLEKLARREMTPEQAKETAAHFPAKPRPGKPQ